MSRPNLLHSESTRVSDSHDRRSRPVRGSWSPGGTAITAVVSLIHRDHNIVRPSNENEANDLISIFDDEDPSHRATGEDLSKSLVAHGTHKLTGFTERGPTSVTTQFSTPSEKRYVNLEYDNRFSSLSLETKKRQDGIPPGASCDLHRLFGAEWLRFPRSSLFVDKARLAGTETGNPFRDCYAFRDDFRLNFRYGNP